MNKLLPYALAALLCSGCTHSYYMPNSMQIPNLHQRNDVVLSVGACKLDGWEAQALYSPVKNGYVLLNHMNIPSNAQSKNGGSGSGSFTEFGAGTYWSDENWCLSLSSGFGKGYVKNHYVKDSLVGADFFSLQLIHDRFNSSMRFRRWFVQPSLSYEGNWFFTGAALKFVGLNYYNQIVDPGLSAKFPEESNAIESLLEGSPLRFTELGLSVGLKMRLLRLSYNISKIGLSKNKAENLHILPKNQSLMLALNIHELWRKKKKR